MKKKTFLLNIIIVFVVFLSSCMWFGAEEEVEVPAGIDATSVEYESYASCVQQCTSCEENCLNSVYYVKALQEGDTNGCSRIVSQTIREDCEQTLLATEAVEQLNKEKCMMLTEEALQQSCLVHVAAEAAVQSDSPDKCSDAPDVEKCEAIFYKDMALLYNDLGFCDNLQGDNKDACYLLLAEVAPEESGTE